MKHTLFYKLGLIVLVMVAFATSHAQAGGTSGPYYATPSWDQKLACDSPSRCPRFLVLSNWDNEAVLDRETGLVWERVPVAGTSPCNRAEQSCMGRRVGGRMGWRLPTVQDYMSLMDPNGNPLVLPPGHPFTLDVTAYGYCTSTHNTYYSPPH